MYKRVDGTDSFVEPQGFSYLDYVGDEIRVKIDDDFIGICEDGHRGYEIAFVDVPKLILALQACLKQHQEESNID